VSKGIRILYLSSGCFDKGGISRYNRYQITALRELIEPDNVRVISLAGRQDGDFEELFEVSWTGSGPDILGKVRFVFEVLRQILWWHPRFIWVGHVNFSCLALFLGRLRGAQVILNTYGLEVWSGLKPASEWGLRHVPVVISDCHYTARYLEESGFRIPGSTTVIWDCVELTRFFPAAPDPYVLERYGLPDPGKFPMIITLGRISRIAKHKGYDRLLKAFVKVHRQLPKAHLVFAGKGDLIPELRVMAETLGVADRVIFTGMVEERHLVDVYRCSRVFSLVSDRGTGRGEGIPLTPLEAMACGGPIIVGDQDGSQEAVVKNQNGYCISPDNIEFHSDILIKLIIDDVHHRTMATAAVNVTRESFSYEGFKRKHRVLISQLVAEK